MIAIEEPLLTERNRILRKLIRITQEHIKCARYQKTKDYIAIWLDREKVKKQFPRLWKRFFEKYILLVHIVADRRTDLLDSQKDREILLEELTEIEHKMGKKEMTSSIEIRRIDITRLETEAIVNAANTWLQEGNGVCGCIFRAAGEKEMAAACDRIGHCDSGDVVITPGFALPAKYVIHAVGPIWTDGTEGEPEILANAYRNALKLAKENGIHTIGFPLISAGHYGYPMDLAWDVAIRICRNFLRNNTDYKMEITFAVLDEEVLFYGEKTLMEYEKRSRVIAEMLAKLK